jgi:biopolymer transport protein ExbB
MSTQKEKGSVLPVSNIVVFVIVFIISILIYKFVLGSSSNVDEHGHAIPGNLLGMMYAGGFIVPILLTLFISMCVFSIERYLSLGKAAGGSDVDGFLKKITNSLESNDIEEARNLCHAQKGTIANVTLAGVDAFENMSATKELSGEQKILKIQKEMEETTALELPMLQKNMSILSTLASIATLLGLIGTVIGMINSFKALAAAGAPDQTALATGISEALINTALGISTSFFAIIAYNYFSTKIDGMTYKMDESQFLISQSFASRSK